MQDIIAQLQEATGYSEDEDGSVDDLIAYKDALEDYLGRDSAALDRIAALMSGTQWDSDTIEGVYEIVTATGREILDPADGEGS